MPYVSYVQSRPPQIYTFSSNEGHPAKVIIPTAFDLSSTDLTLELDRNSRFISPITKGSVIYENGEITLFLSAADVDALGDGFFRIWAQRNGQSTILVTGSVDYIPRNPDQEVLLDLGGAVRVEFVEPLTVALEDVFLRRDEFVAGVVDPEVLSQAVDNKLAAHIQSPTPHTAYDVEMQKLAILFENRLI